MVVGAAGVDEVLLGLEPALVPVQSIKNIGRFVLAGSNRQDVKMAVLIGDPGVEFDAGVAAVVSVDVAAPGPAGGGAEELPVRR